MHPPHEGSATASDQLGKRLRKLHGSVALNDSVKPDKQASSAHFRILGDGKVIWKSKGLQGKGTNAGFELSVRGVSELTLETLASGRRDWLHAFWLDLIVAR